MARKRKKGFVYAPSRQARELLLYFDNEAIRKHGITLTELYKEYAGEGVGRVGIKKAVDYLHIYGKILKVYFTEDYFRYFPNYATYKDSKELHGYGIKYTYVSKPMFKLTRRIVRMLKMKELREVYEL